MTIHEQIREILTNHKNKVEITQWAIMSSIASLVYTEYIRRFQQVYTPKRTIFIPKLDRVRSLISADGEFMNYLSLHLIDDMINTFYNRYDYIDDAPELILFRTDKKSELLKSIYDLYMVPNIIRRLPETISKKFGLGTSINGRQLFIENNEIDIFPDFDKYKDEYYRYIADEAVLQLLILLPTMKKDIILPQSNESIDMEKDMILTIGNETAITPIHLDDEIINKDSHIIDLFEYITGTTISHRAYGYHLRSEPNNQISLTTLKGIQYTEEG